ncbi:hypothetical protein EMPS_08539 [Entomortierella parvispora]|uniref:Peptide hydrolase n=1 Tax=Entomortierella parvispora TaxID=205924 RepID=A0A9P3LZQ4_9FUNG|nr:hypothetical protein EMPS_08539 [Entomortierella parvispora]
MNSPPPITSRANRRRAHSLDNPTQPLLGSIGRRRSDRRAQDEVAELNHRRHKVSVRQCWSIYLILALLYGAVLAIVYYGRRADGFVPALPDMTVGETLPDTFNPHTAFAHLKEVTKAPHPFNSRANTDLVKRYIRDQFRELQAEALALGRRNVRYDDGQDNATWTSLKKSRQQQEMENSGETEAPEGQELLQEELQVVQSDNMVMWVGGVRESREGEDEVPVFIEIGVDEENQSALLVSAHFDSVSTSYGQTDDGGGVAVSLAMIRHFIHHPVQHTIIFLLNNAEEDGLLGASTFMGAPPNSTTETGSGHPWKKHIKAFVNLEGGGSGGPSLLFRASNYDIVRQYADHAPFPHASVFSSDLFSLGLLNSDTDYSVFVLHNLPGLDIAFYRRRSMYHTTTDFLPIESLYHMGANTQATIAGLCNSPYLDKLHSQEEPLQQSAPLSPRTWFAGKSVFYDVIGKFMLASELWSFLLINGLALGFGLPVLALTAVYTGKAIKSRRTRQQSQDSQAEQPNQTHSLRTVLDSSSFSIMGYSDDGYSSIQSRPSSSSRRIARAALSSDYLRPRGPAVLRTVALLAILVALDVGAVFGASKWQFQTNPFVRYNHIWVVLLGLFLLLSFVNTLVVYVTTALETLIFGSVPVALGATHWTLALGIWWWLIVLVVGTGFAAWAGTGVIYGTPVLAVFAGAAALLQILLNLSDVGATSRLKNHIGWISVLAVGLVAPVLVVLDLLVIVAYMTCQSFIPADGGIMYIVYGLLLIPIGLAAVPTISRARNFKASVALQLLFLLAVAWYLSMAPSFSAENPSSLYYNQLYNQTTGTSTVRLGTDSGEGYILKMLENVPQNITGPRSDCQPAMTPNGFMERCEFSPVRQIFQDVDRDSPLHVEWISRPEPTAELGWREGHLQILALESRFCTVHVAETSKGRETQLWVDGMAPPKADEELLNHRAKYLEMSLHEWNRAWSVHVRVRAPEDRGGGFNENNKGNGDKKPPAPKTIPVPIKVICGYEDWISDQGYATTFNSIRTHIPDWARMKGNSIHGLFSIGVDLQF